MQEVQACFASWDLEGRGTIDKTHLARVLHALSPSLTPADLDALLQKAGSEAHGQIRYEPLIQHLCREISIDLRAEAVFLALDAERESKLDLQWLLKEEDIHFRGPALRAMRRTFEIHAETVKSVLTLQDWQAIFVQPSLQPEEETSSRDVSAELSALEEIAKLYVSMRFRDLSLIVAHPFASQSPEDYVGKEDFRAFLAAARCRGHNGAPHPAVTMMLEAFDKVSFPEGKTLSFQGWRQFMDAARAALSLQSMVQALLICEDETNCQLNDRYEAVFTAIDGDCSCALDKTEMVQYMTAAGLPYRSAAAAAAVLEQSCDTNKDGKVTLSEWKAMFAADRKKKGAQGAVRTLCWFESIAADFLERRGKQAYEKLKSTCELREGSVPCSEVIKRAEAALQSGCKAGAAQFGTPSASAAASHALQVLQELRMTTTASGSSSDDLLTAEMWQAMLQSKLEQLGRKKFAEVLAGMDALCHWMQLSRHS
mmetsp:Transcript_10995/g.25115  ORF Transcript_10995/g.25115 Transcript_10995/m.25115 type:complete len:483 (-) Transcript_10995:43-1491(-)